MVVGGTRRHKQPHRIMCGGAGVRGLLAHCVCFKGVPGRSPRRKQRVWRHYADDHGCRSHTISHTIRLLMHGGGAVIVRRVCVSDWYAPQVCVRAAMRVRSIVPHTVAAIARAYDSHAQHQSRAQCVLIYSHSDLYARRQRRAWRGAAHIQMDPRRCRRRRVQRAIGVHTRNTNDAECHASCARVSHRVTHSISTEPKTSPTTARELKRHTKTLVYVSHECIKHAQKRMCCELCGI